MSVGRDYMVRKGAGPSAPKFFLDTEVLPRLVDATGAAEVALDRAARAAGVRPSLLLVGAAGALSIAVAGAFGAGRAKRAAADRRGDQAATTSGVDRPDASQPDRRSV
ncbi:hypothetical protein J2Y58_000486 [Sphingomonas sp. BE138]|uniref:hypothetical protein n=1 Tax=Sphingomonas sp. BE138 TaxID=2817845 RepID=UPI00285CC0D9|nr:hypothetical protein [Sphingomonas sp. BE138]MDR6787148.1 hypothetical protein [Sphingomonas sp. BE138]